MCRIAGPYAIDPFAKLTANLKVIANGVQVDDLMPLL